MRLADPDFRPGPVLRVFGMRRSGNHSIIDSILRNAPGGNAVFFNNCKAPQDPMGSHRSLTILANGASSRAENDAPLADRLAQAGPRPLTVVSVEDAMPRANLRPIWAGSEQLVLIYRSFLNWSASLLKKVQRNPSYGSVERMRILMQACRTYTKALDLVAKPGAFTPVLFDRWIASDTYRAETLTSLGLPASDLSLGEVQRFGGGSSFQADTRDPAELATDRRADQLSDDPEFGVVLWTVAHDPEFMTRIAEHFPQDAARIEQLARSSRPSFHLPARSEH